MATDIIDEVEESCLSYHVGHKIECVSYGKHGLIAGFALECVDCNEVLYSEEFEDSD